MLKSKYKYDIDNISFDFDSSSCSFVWKGFMKGFNLLCKGLSWKIGNGEEFLFWSDKWFYGNYLKDHNLDNFSIDWNLKVYKSLMMVSRILISWSLLFPLT